MHAIQHIFSQVEYANNTSTNSSPRQIFAKSIHKLLNLCVELRFVNNNCEKVNFVSGVNEVEGKIGEFNPLMIQL
jgi:hypothetical protein